MRSFAMLLALTGIATAQEGGVGTYTISPSQTVTSVAPRCPMPDPCKVLYLTVQEEQVLLGDKGIFDTAYEGRPLDLGRAIMYFRRKVETAQPGLPNQPPPP